MFSKTLVRRYVIAREYRDQDQDSVHPYFYTIGPTNTLHSADSAVRASIPGKRQTILTT
jgi:hypothetical protein